MRRHPDHSLPACRPASSLVDGQRGRLERAALLAAALVASLVLGACSAPSVDTGTADAVEVGKAIGTGIYTKVAGVPFDLDVLLDGADSITYTSGSGSTKMDLVDLDKSGGACGTVGDNAQVAKSSTSNVILQGLNPGGSYGDVRDTASYGGANSGKRDITTSDKQKNRYRFTVKDAVANVKVRFRVQVSYTYSCGFMGWGTCSASPDLSRCSYDSFTIRPANFALTSTPGGAQTQVAGDTFTRSARAMLADGTTLATGYAGTNVKPTVDASKLTDWTTAAIPAGSWSGSYDDAVAGVATGTNFKYTDFGQLTTPVDTVVDSTFSSKSGDIGAGHCVVNSSSNTLSGGKYGCNIANQIAYFSPRFIPDHYEVNHAFTPACGSGGFTYLGQDFGALTLTVEAKNSAGANMTRLTSGAPNKPTFKVEEKNSGTLLGTITNAGTSGTRPVTLTTPEWPAATPGGAYANTSKTTVRPASPALHDSFTLVTTVTDGDGRQITKCNGNTVAATSCTSPETKLRYGELELSDGLGATGLPAAVRVRALYWNGSAFVLNAADSCTTIQVNANTIASNLTGSTLTGLVPKNSSTLLATGVGALMLASQANKTGSAPIALKLGSGNNNCVSATTSGAGTLNTLSGYLGGISCGAGVYDKDPSATITFGTLRTPYIYRSEKF